MTLPLVLVMLVAPDGLLAQLPALEPADREDPADRFRLPSELVEISGLVWHPDGLLLTHNDEHGIVFSIDPEDGEIVGRLELPRAERTGDYEGITLLGDGRLLLTTSTGRLVSVDIETGSARAWMSGVEDSCEIEGLATLPTGRDVVLACKTLYQGSDRDAVVLLRTDGTDPDSTPSLHLVVSGDQLRQANVPRPFFASGVEVVPGGYLIVSARRARVLAVDLDGRIVHVARLRRGGHPQAEGITMDPQNNLWIADEGDGGRGRLSRYPLGGSR